MIQTFPAAPGCFFFNETSGHLVPGSTPIRMFRLRTKNKKSHVGWGLQVSTSTNTLYSGSTTEEFQSLSKKRRVDFFYFHTVQLPCVSKVYTTNNVRYVSAKPQISSNSFMLHLHICCAWNLYFSHVTALLCSGLVTKDHLVIVRKTSRFGLKYLVFVDPNTAGDVWRSPSKHPLLSPQKQLEMAQLCWINTGFGRQNHGWKRLEVTLKTPSSVVPNMAESLSNIPGFGCHKHRWKFSSLRKILVNTKKAEERKNPKKDSPSTHLATISTNRGGEIQRFPSKHPVLIPQNSLKNSWLQMKTHPALVSTNTNKRSPDTNTNTTSWRVTSEQHSQQISWKSLQDKMFFWTSEVFICR